MPHLHMEYTANLTELNADVATATARRMPSRFICASVSASIGCQLRLPQ